MRRRQPRPSRDIFTALGESVGHNRCAQSQSAKGSQPSSVSDPKLIGATGLTPQRMRERPLTCCIDYTLGACALSPEFTPESVPGWLMGTNKADDEDSCLGQAKLRMVKDQAWPIIRGLRC